jgi:hypothetical protein
MSEPEVIDRYYDIPKTNYYQLVLRDNPDDEYDLWFDHVKNYSKPVCVTAYSYRCLVPFLIALGSVPHLKLLGVKNRLTKSKIDKLKSHFSADKVEIEVSERTIDPHWFLINTSKMSITVKCYCGYSGSQLLDKIKGQTNEHVRFLEFDDDECGIYVPGIHTFFSNIRTLKTELMTDAKMEGVEKIPRFICHHLCPEEYLALLEKTKEMESIDVEVQDYDGGDLVFSDLPSCPNYRVKLPDGETLHKGSVPELGDLC